MPLSAVKILNLRRLVDPRGSITVIEDTNDIPFIIKRLYYLYDVPSGAERGGHAHKQLEQVIIAVAGSFDIELDDGVCKKTFHLNRAYYGLYIPSMIWRVINNFSTGSVCLVIASDQYYESDYYRSYSEFCVAASHNRTDSGF